MIAELSAFQAATNSLKAAGEIVKAMIGMKVTAEVQAKIIELQTVILSAQSGAMDAQSAQMSLLQRVRELESELMKLEDWETEKKRYRLQKFEPASVVYVLTQEAMSAGEPEHTICPNCYRNRQKSILQWTGQSELRRRVFACVNPQCGARFVLGAQEPMPPPQRQEDYSVFGEE